MKELPVIPDPGPDAEASRSASPSTALVYDPLNTLKLKPQVIEALSTVFDPEIPVNIYDLGLVYDIFADANAVVGVRMTLTAPACPAAQTLPGEVQQKIREIPSVSDARVDIVWDPPWDKDRMSDAA